MIKLYLFDISFDNNFLEYKYHIIYLKLIKLCLFDIDFLEYWYDIIYYKLIELCLFDIYVDIIFLESKYDII